MRIGILMNCHGFGLAASLQALLPDAQVKFFLMQRILATERLRAYTLETLKRCDHVITCKFRPSYGALATAALATSVKSLHLMPPFHFRGFHPDTIRVPLAAGNLAGPTGAYHSRIAVAAFLGGLRPAQAAALYNRLVFSRLDYAGAFPRERALLCNALAACQIDGEAIWRQLNSGTCFMHSFEHPKVSPLLEVARIICGHIGAAPQTAVAAESIHDDLVAAPIHPVFDDLAAMLGVAPDGMFRGPIGADGTFDHMEPEDFIARCFAKYETAPREALLKADGVAQAMAALALRSHVA